MAINEARPQTVVSLLANHIGAYHRSKAAGNLEWLNRHADAVDAICKQCLPSGAGIDSGSTIALDVDREDRIVITTSFHHTAESGMYDGWTEHAIHVRPSFVSQVSIRVTGRDRNGIKDYLAETFDYALTRIVVEAWDTETERYTYRVPDPST